MLRKQLFEAGHGHGLVDAAALERISADQRLGFLPRLAVDDDERAVTRPVRTVFERSAENNPGTVGFQKILVRASMLVAQRGGVGTVETNDGVHGMVREYG